MSSLNLNLTLISKTLYPREVAHSTSQHTCFEPVLNAAIMHRTPWGLTYIQDKLINPCDVITKTPSPTYTSPYDPPDYIYP